MIWSVPIPFSTKEPGSGPAGLRPPRSLAGGVLLALGLVLGLLGALLAARAIQGLLFGVAPYDPATFGAVAVVMAVIGVGAFAARLGSPAILCPDRASFISGIRRALEDGHDAELGRAFARQADWGGRVDQLLGLVSRSISGREQADTEVATS